MSCSITPSPSSIGVKCFFITTLLVVRATFPFSQVIGVLVHYENVGNQTGTRQHVQLAEKLLLDNQWESAGVPLERWVVFLVGMKEECDLLFQLILLTDVLHFSCLPGSLQTVGRFVPCVIITFPWF